METDLNRLSQELLKMTVEAALDVGLDDHLGYRSTTTSDWLVITHPT
jgi:transposase-like protein